MTLNLKKIEKILKDKDLTEHFLNKYPDFFSENDYELAEYALIKNYKDSFRIIFERFFPDIKKIFQFGFVRSNAKYLIYDKYARMHEDFLKCYLDDDIKVLIYGK